MLGLTKPYGLRAFAAPLAALLVVAGPPAAAQSVVQPLPGGLSAALDAALGRLARNPRDIAALIDAGNAALAMGDVEAATGFFRRADQVSPGNPRVRAGLAGAMVRSGDPFGAIPLFDEAERAGALDGTLAADRGLAYDLVGDNVAAQRYYRQALARTPSEEVTRRLALSLAIAGDRQRAEQTLSPLLQQRNLAAWRTRAFALAILGRTEEGVNIANNILPADLAASIAPYLRYMPRLTRAQQAAAANFGAFPRASEIGRDDPRVAEYAPGRGRLAAADTALVPRGEPLGRDARSRDRAPLAAREAAPAPVRPRQSRADTARVAPPDVQPAREASASLAVASVARPAAPAPAPVVRTPAAAPSAPAMLPVAPGFVLAPAAPTAPASPPPTPAAAPPPPAAAPSVPPPPRSLRDAFAEFARPSVDVTPASGAVDLRRIKPTRPKPEKPPEPPKPSHPSRIWVQVATGRDKAALGFDWRRMVREDAAVLRGKQAFTSEWGRNNRLLTGPFPSEAAAGAFITQLRRTDVDGAFVWISPAGQVVDPLGGEPAKR